MTVSSQVLEAKSLCNGVTTVFPVPFQYIDSSDLAVSLLDAATGAESSLSEGTDYTLSGTPTAGTVSITAIVAFPTGKILWRRRETALTQEQPYTPNDGFPAKSHEAALDKLTYIAQEQQDQVTDLANRSFLVPPNNTAGRFPDLSTLYGLMLGIDADGNIVGAENGDADPALRPALASPDGSGSALVSYSDIPGGATMSIRSKLRTTQSGEFAETTFTREDTGQTLVPVMHYVRLQGRSIEAYGGRPDASGATNLQALLATLAKCKTDGAPILFDRGSYDIDLAAVAGSAVLDVTRMSRGAWRGVPWVAPAGPGQTALNLLNADPTKVALQIIGPTGSWFDPIFEGFTVQAVTAGCMVAIGQGDYSDFVNMLKLRDMSFENSANSANTITLRLNYVAGGKAESCRANAYALANDAGTELVAVAGNALQLRQAEMFKWTGGSIGNADIAVRFQDGVNVCVHVDAATLENHNIAVAHDSSISGAQLFSACQITNTLDIPIRSTGCNGSLEIVFDACNFSAPGDLVDQVNFAGVRIVDRRGISTPALPTSGTTLRNTTGRTIGAYFSGGSGLSLTVTSPAGDNNIIPSGSIAIVRPGGAVTPSYATAPTMHWDNLGI